MHRLRPAPLLLVALAFGLGSYLGLTQGFDSLSWLLACSVAATLWLAAITLAHTTGWRRVAYGLLLLLTITVGGYHGSWREDIAHADDLRALPDEKANPRTQWRGEVTGDPRFRPRKDQENSGRTTLVLRVTGWRRAGSGANEPWQPARGLVQVRVDQTEPDRYRYGDTLQVLGGLETPEPPVNPGQFDVATWLWQRDIYYQTAVTAVAVTLLSRDGGEVITRLAWRARDWSLAQLRLGLENDPAISSLLAGMLIGYVDQVPPEIETAFRNTGTYHIFAVSGQNVAVICGVGLVALQMLGLVRWRWGWVLVPLLVFYCLVTGGQPSAVRALLMAVLVLIAWSLERPVSVLNLWSLALLLVLAYDAKLVLNLSFQLSFAVVGALIVLTPLFYNHMAQWCGLVEEEETDDAENDLPPVRRGPWAQQVRQWGRALVLLVASSLAAWIGSLPLMAWYFHQVTLVGLVANLVVVPLAGLIVVVGALALAVAPLSAALTTVINNANWLLAKGLVWIVTAFAQIPGGCFYVPDLSVAWRPAEPEFVCTASGGTSALLIRYGDKTWLVNTGTESQFRYVTNPLRKFYGVNRFDEVILSELGALHAGGALLLASEAITADWVTPPQQKITRALQPWLDLIQQQGATPRLWSRGQEETLAPGFTVSVLSPPEDNRASRMEDRGLVLLFRYHPPQGPERTLLYAGRIGRQTEAEILTQTTTPLAEVLIQGRHGAQPNLDLAWLEAVRPQQVILSALTAYVPERMDSIELLPAEQRPRIWRQEECGAVTVRLKSSGVEVVPFLHHGREN